MSIKPSNGYLDVTLYGAAAAGTSVSTDQTNKAVRDARDFQLACYFSSGTYLADDPITALLS